jgi:hypothetical protein
MFLSKIWKRPWQNNDKSPIRKELQIIYGWASIRVPVYQRCPYVYVFRLRAVPNGDAIPNAVRRGRELRQFVCENLLWETTSLPNSAANRELLRYWDEIIPAPARLPTHRLELGILRKQSGIPRSPFFDEYFCFLSFSGKDSDRVARRIAGFLSSQMEDTQGFQGEALKNSRAYWLAAILAAWKQFG